MSVKAVIEQLHLRTGGISASPTSVRIFLVYCDSLTDDESVALFAVDPTTSLAIPTYYSTHPTRAFLYATNIYARNCSDKQANLWEVTVNYELANAAPWYAPVVITGDQSQFDKIVDYDLATGKVVTNSAGFKFDPPLTAKRHNATISFQKAILSFDTTIPAAWVDTVNTDTFYGAAPGYAMCMGIPWQLAQWPGPTGSLTAYYTVTFNFEIKNPSEHSWFPIIADQGFYQLNSGGTAVKQILDPLFGQPVTQPWPLDGSGHAQTGPTFSYVGKTFTTYNTGTFATLAALWT